jgi:hypothetical protein
MWDQLFEGFRRASESSFQLQQDLLKSMGQPWSPAGGMSGSGDPTRGVQRRWLEMTIDMLNKQREATDAAYKAGIQALDETFRVSESKSPEDYRRSAEELWHKLFEVFRSVYERELQELQKFANVSFDAAQAQAQPQAQS